MVKPMAKAQLMEEKAAFEQAVGIKSGFKGLLVSALKFFFAIAMVPLLIGLGRAFYQQLLPQPEAFRFSFLIGAASYVVVHLFLLQPARMHEAGQMLIGKLFSFYVPLRTIMHLSLPLYTVVLFGAYFIVKNYSTLTLPNIDEYAIFLIAFTATMHCVVTASGLRNDVTDTLRGDYFFSLFAISIFEILLLSGMLQAMLPKFSFMAVLREGFDYFSTTAVLVWKQLFVVGK